MSHLIAVEGLGRSYEELNEPGVATSLSAIGVSPWTRNPGPHVGKPNKQGRIRHRVTDLNIMFVDGTKERFFLFFDGNHGQLKAVTNRLRAKGFTVVHSGTIEEMLKWKDDPSRREVWNRSTIDANPG